MRAFFKAVASDSAGAAVIELALISAIVGLGIVTAMQGLSHGLIAAFVQTASDLAASSAE